MSDSSGDTPVLDTLAAINQASVEQCGLDLHALMLVRLAALAAVDARPLSYAANLEAAVEGGITLEETQDVLVAVAPIIGTARTMSAVLNIAEGLGLAISATEDD
jgi:hypothetical protein